MEAQLKKFIEEVEPYLQLINSYLPSTDQDRPSEDVCALGRLAECAVEARRFLAQNSLTASVIEPPFSDDDLPLRAA